LDSSFFFCSANCCFPNSYWQLYNKVIRKVRKHSTVTLSLVIHRVIFKRKPVQKYINIQRGMKLRKPSILVENWVSSDLSFFLSASTAATYIFTAHNCTTTIISLKPSALNAEYQHFILSLLKCLYFADTTERGDRGWKEAQRLGEDRITLWITLMSPFFPGPFLSCCSFPCISFALHYYQFTFSHRFFVNVVAILLWFTPFIFWKWPG